MSSFSQYFLHDLIKWNQQKKAKVVCMKFASLDLERSSPRKVINVEYRID